MATRGRAAPTDPTIHSLAQGMDVGQETHSTSSAAYRDGLWRDWMSNAGLLFPPFFGCSAALPGRSAYYVKHNHSKPWLDPAFGELLDSIKRRHHRGICGWQRHPLFHGFFWSRRYVGVSSRPRTPRPRPPALSMRSRGKFALTDRGERALGSATCHWREIAVWWCTNMQPGRGEKKN